jgi:hypothetical protein
MNSRYEKQYKEEELRIIGQSIEAERSERKLIGLVIASRTINGRRILNKRIADIANDKLKNKSLNIRDIERFKTCKRHEFEARTGKCTWSIPSVRKKLGFDPITGKEAVE